MAVHGVYGLAVAPVMATPFAVHGYFSVTGAGPNAPAAVKTVPTLTAPLITGTGALRVPTAPLSAGAVCAGPHSPPSGFPATMVRKPVFPLEDSAVFERRSAER